MQNALFLKVIVVGDSGVGKTSILNQYCYEKFDVNIRPTVGCDFTLKAFTDYNGKSIRMQLWDVAGQERFHSLSKLYVRGAMGCIVVCDITSDESLAATLKWKDIIIQNADPVDGRNIPIILLSNKCDLVADIPAIDRKQCMSKEYIESFATTHGFQRAFLVSAKTGENIDSSIKALLDEMLTYDIPIKEFGKGQMTGGLANGRPPTDVSASKISLKAAQSKGDKNSGCSC
jgi:small GTP-binding protein